MDLGFILPKLVMIFAPMIVAFIAVKCKKWGADGNKVLSTLVTCVTNPATIISAAISGQRPLSNSQVFVLTAIAIAFHVFLIASSYLIPWMLRIKQDKHKVWRALYIFCNMGFFGLPVCTALFGQEAAFPVAIYILPFQSLMYTYGILLIAEDGQKRKFTAKMLLHPMIIACCVAYILYLVNPTVPEIIREPIAFIGQATSPVAMMAVGGTLAFAPLKKVFLNGRLYLLVLIKMLVVPIAMLLLLNAFLPDSPSTKLIIGVSVIIVSTPTAAATTMLANLYKGDTETTSSGVCLTTLATVVTIPLLMWLIGIVQ